MTRAETVPAAWWRSESSAGPGDRAGRKDLKMLYNVPCKIGEIYEDPDGIWEILDIAGQDVKIQEVNTGQVWEGVSLKDVAYFCKVGIRNLTKTEEREILEDLEEETGFDYLED